MTSQAIKTSIKPRAVASLKEAVSDLVDAVGGQVRAAELVGLSKSQIHRYTDSDTSERDYNMPVNVVRILEKHAGEPIVTRYLAAEMGFVLHCEDALALPTSENLPELLGLVTRECSDVYVAGLDAVADGEVSPDEAAEIVRQCDEASTAILKVRAKARSIAFPIMGDLR